LESTRPTAAVAHEKAAGGDHTAAVGRDGWLFFWVNFVNNLKRRNCKYESCVSRKVTKLNSYNLSFDAV
jgi:hypothetical protein